jgi:branched-chain amino acid transport system substrate-binding protein
MVNEAGGLLGREVELVVLDNASDDAIVGADYEKLITEEQVDLVLGTQSSFLNLPASAAAAEHGYAFIGPSAGAPDMFNRGLNNYFFAQPAVAARQADPFALHILGLDTDVRPQTFAVVTGDDPFALGVMERLSSLLIDGELELVMETVYPLETTDFSDIAAEVAEIDPDLIIGGTTFPDSVGQIQAYQEVGYQPRFAYFTSGPSQPTPFREALGDATEGIYSSVSWFPDGKDYQNAEFTAKYIEMFGGTLGDMPEDAANGFTAGQVLRQAVENIESIDNAELIEELRRGTFDTVVGPLNFDDTGAPLGSYMLLQWHGDTFVIVGPEDRAEVDALDPPKPEW